ncbi:Myb-like, SWIRM and MPN domains 1, partial [Cladochytrium tenue]
ETEVIGLVGGRFDDAARRLYILDVFPCKSVGTGIQCEMDPESEVLAHQHFARLGLVVVGWYHSHPTFAPHPSVRDVETQAAHQRLFRRATDGIEPFVGAIINPWDTPTPLAAADADGAPCPAAMPFDSGDGGGADGIQREAPCPDVIAASRIAWILVERSKSDGENQPEPFACRVVVDPTQSLSDDVRSKLLVLVAEAATSNKAGRINMSDVYACRDGSLLRRSAKVIAALRVAAGGSLDAAQTGPFLRELEELLVERLDGPGEREEGSGPSETSLSKQES